jgi:DNA modification methylase
MTSSSLLDQSGSGPQWEIRVGDALERLREIPDESVQCVVTSPPYWGLRDYGVDGQIGLEPTLPEFLARLVDVFREVRRVLRSDGVCWVNMGDSYAANAGYRSSGDGGPALVGTSQYDRGAANGPRRPPHGIKAKDLIGQPWRLAFALQDDGWWLRSEIIWHKPTPMPESVTDRPTRAHEQVFLLTKAPRYFYDADAIREPLAAKTLTTFGTQRQGAGEASGLVAAANWARDVPERKPKVDAEGDPVGANKRTVWTVYSEPYPEAHFATFPPALVTPCVLAGTSAHGACAECGAPWRRITSVESVSDRPGRVQGRDGDTIEQAHAADGRAGDRRSAVVSTLGWEATCDHDAEVRPCVVLDPFSGAGTTIMESLRHGRSAIGLELNPEYADLARRRICDDAPLLNTTAEVAA